MQMLKVIEYSYNNIKNLIDFLIQLKVINYYLMGTAFLHATDWIQYFSKALHIDII